MITTKKTLCNRDCPDVCGIVADVEDGRILKIGGDPDHPITQGFLCHRTGRFLELQYARQRITTPLLKKDGAHVPVSWDEALDFAAEALLRIKAESGPQAIFHYRSGGNLGFLLAATDLFFGKLGPVTTKRGDICSGAGDAAQLLDFGVEDANDVHDLANSESIVLWGKNVFVSSPHSIPLLKDAKKRGARVLYVDPVRTKTVTLADRFVQVRPGADFALAMATAAIVVDEGRVDPDAASYCDHLDDFIALARSRTLASWCAEADVAADDARALADALGRDKPAAILVGWGMGRRSNGAAVVRALDALSAITGNLGVPGGGVAFYWNRKTAFDVSFSKITPPRTICEPLFGEEVLTAKDPPIRAVWITAGNPVAMLPDSKKVAEALASRELVVVADNWMSDTAQLAHLILPVPTLLEADDLLGSYGHHYIGASTPIVPPPPEVKSDLEIMQGLAARTGLERELAGTAADWKRRIAGPRLGPYGVTVEDLERGAVKNPLTAPVLFADRRFATPSGKVNLVVAAPAGPPVTDEEWPMTLMACSTDRSQSSVYTRPQHGPAVVTVHPDAARGIAHGGAARLESAVSSLNVVVHHDPAQRRDVALMAKGGGFFAGRSANVLLRGAITDMGEGGALYDERVRLVPADR